MDAPETTQPLAEKNATVRRRLGVKEELTLALLPTLTVLLVFGWCKPGADSNSCSRRWLRAPF